MPLWSTHRTIPAAIIATAGLASLWFGVIVLPFLLIALIACALFNPPPRYRHHGWGQINQAVDHSLGMSGGTYPEEPLGPESRKQTGRNDPCPCGSGEKFKRCHGRDQSR